MPLGTAGKALAIVSDMNSVIAAWLIMKRGCWLGVAGDKRLAKILEKWHIGKNIEKYRGSDPIDIAWKNRFKTVVVSERVGKKLLDKLYDKRLLVLRPLVGFKPSQIKALLGRIHSK